MGRAPNWEEALSPPNCFPSGGSWEEGRLFDYLPLGLPVSSVWVIPFDLDLVGKSGNIYSSSIQMEGHQKNKNHFHCCVGRMTLWSHVYTCFSISWYFVGSVSNSFKFF